MFDPKPSPVPGMKIVNIRGVPSQMEEVVRLIHQTTGSRVSVVVITINAETNKEQKTRENKRN